MSFPRYPRYQDSGVEWLDDVPEHWSLKRFKRMLKEREERSAEGNELLLSVSAYTGVSPRSEVIDEGDHLSRAESLVGYKVCYEDDLVMNIMLAWNRGLAFTKYHGIVSPAYCVFDVTDGSDPDFLNYLVRSDEYTLYFKAFSSGVIDSRLRIYPDTFGGLFCGLPPLEEQTAIAAFLDRETAKIDGLVAEQRRLMELLNEQIISLALSPVGDTKQLRLGSIASIVSRPVKMQQGQLYTRLGLYNRGRGLFHKPVAEMEDMGESDFFWIESGDLIISGQFAWEGAVALAGDNETGCVVSHRYPVLRGRDGLALTEYLFALLCTSHGDFLFNENSRGAAGRNRPLNISLLMKEKVPVPNMRTQELVAQAIHTKTPLFKEIARQINLLQERRTALISAAVTGQIDVRGAVKLKESA